MNISNIKWTPELVEEWIDIAVKVERALPPVGQKPLRGQNFATQTDYISLLWDLLDDDRKNKEPKFYPTNEQVSQWEIVVLRWFPAISDKDDMKLLWWRACGMSWAKISKRLHYERHTCMRHYKRALETLSNKLNTKVSKELQSPNTKQ